MHKSVTIGLFSALLAGSSTLALAVPHHETSDAVLQREARISVSQARATALRRARGKIDSEELERENGKLIYSFDIRVPHKSGITEIAVSAITGKILSVKHETPAHEAAETRKDAAAAKHR